VLPEALRYPRPSRKGQTCAPYIIRIMEKTRYVEITLIIAVSPLMFLQPFTGSPPSGIFDKGSTFRVEDKEGIKDRKLGRNNGNSGVGFGRFLKALSQSGFTSHFRSG